MGLETKQYVSLTGFNAPEMVIKRGVERVASLFSISWKQTHDGVYGALVFSEVNREGLHLGVNDVHLTVVADFSAAPETYKIINIALNGCEGEIAGDQIYTFQAERIEKAERL